MTGAELSGIIANMSIVLYTVCFLLLLITTILCYLVRKLKVFEDAFRSFISCPAEGKPSPLAELVDLMLSRVITHFKASNLANLSATARQVKAIESSMIGDTLESKNPALGMVWDSMGKRTQNQLSKYSGLIQALLSKKGVDKSNGNGDLSRSRIHDFGGD